MKRLFTHFPSCSSMQEYTHKPIFAVAMMICLLFSSAVASAQISINANPGTSGNVPLGTSNYAVSESIYTATELGTNFTTAGDEIISIGFTCAVIPSVGTTFTNLKVYLKEVSAATTVFTTGTYSTAGYTQVFGGATGGSIVVTTTGVKTLTLSTPFLRTSSSMNLQMLVTREDNTLHTSNTFATAGGNDASSANLSTRRYNTTAALSGTTSLTASTFRPAIILTSAIPTTPPNCATGMAPASVTAMLVCPNATTSPSSVVFTWTAPASGPAPTGYKFYLAVSPTAPVLLGTVTGTSASVSNLLPSTSYNWYVVSTASGVDAVGCTTPLTFMTDVEPACVANNSCATATLIGTTGNAGTVNSTTTGASISRAGEVCATFTGNADDDVWFRFTTDGDGGDVTVALTGAATALDAVMHVYSGTCSALVNILCADANDVGMSETAALTGLAANTTYYVRVYGYGAYNATTPTSGAFTLTTSGTGVAGTPIPIELKSFTGTVEGSVNALNWETLTEINVKSHIVERSVDGKGWSEVGIVAGKRNSQASVKYTLEDRNPLVKAYYRLRTIDFDGKENLSSTISLTRKGKGFGIARVYPSPTTRDVVVLFNAISEEKVTVRVMDITGRVVIQQVTEAVKDINELPLTLTALQSGVYIVTVSNSTGISTPVRFVKL